ncbi:MAG: hypothetical protein DMG76_23760 [Acidobacteria bacterium]|nr:MAG: hypothetical protein DMG76_23760 [Acidobacteriota bacterium]
MTDPCLHKFESEWAQADTLVDKAIIVYNLVHYVKLRYRGIEKLSTQIAPKVAFLETHVIESGGKDFLKIQRVIADARRTITDCGSKYGSGFRKVPNAAQRRRLTAQFAPVLLQPCPDIVQENSVTDRPFDDLFVGNLDHD